jgi:hypothetical protein
MSRWYRAYAGTVKDDKLAEVSVIAGCSRSVAIAVWHAILESAAETDDGGRFETTPRRVAAALCEPLATIQAVFDGMSEIGMIGADAVTAWKARQYESDKSTERSRKHREAKRNGNATLQGRSATPPEAETDTEEETEDAASAASSASAPVLDLDEAERRCCEAAGSDRLGSFAPIVELLHRQADLERDVLPIVRSRPAVKNGIQSWRYYVPVISEAMAKRVPIAKPSGPPKVFIARDSPEWAERCRVTGHKPGMTTQHPETKADGWYFAAEPSDNWNKGERAA